MVFKNTSISSFFKCQKTGTETIAPLSIPEGQSFWSLDRCTYDCKLRNEKKIFIQERNEFSPQTSKLVVLLTSKKHGGAPKIKRALRGLGGGGGVPKKPRAFLFDDDLSKKPIFGRIHLAEKSL